MKFFIVILAPVALAYAEDEWRPKNVAELNVIRQDFPLNEEYIQKIKNFEYSDEEPVRKYLLCTVKKLGVFYEHEGYHAKQFKMDLDEAIAIVEGCLDKNTEGSSDDVWTYRCRKCVLVSKIGDRVKAKSREKSYKQ